MKGPIQLVSPQVGVAVFVIVFIIAVVLIITVKTPEKPLYYKRPVHYSEHYDKGSFGKELTVFLLFLAGCVILKILLKI